ncbi:hypothetical protein [uncultured Microbacterium sp.]|uniref:hypothetical protein n=1 Tax=uncultured Microbacterium sp. TaxID=191216 RepID=UPI0025914FAB|nr:hypothetical protein [uncultured Microbacterium sp.]
MNQYGTQLREQWELLDPAQAQAVGTDFFKTQGELAQTQIEDLTLRLAGPDLPGETYLEKVGRINNAKTRASEIVMADLPRPTDQSEWEHRFEIWQAGHPTRQLIDEFHRTMDEIEDRTPETAEEEQQQNVDVANLLTGIRADLATEQVPQELIEVLVTPNRVPLPSSPGETIDLWTLSPASTEAIENLLRPQWEALPIETREAAWDAPSDGADYYRATQRVASGLPRF